VGERVVVVVGLVRGLPCVVPHFSLPIAAGSHSLPPCLLTLLLTALPCPPHPHTPPLLWLANQSP
jgi:hypothetical protein